MKAIYKGSHPHSRFHQSQTFNLLVKAQKGAIYIWELDHDGCVGEDSTTAQYASFAAFIADWKIECEDLFEEVKLEQIRQICKFGERNQHSMLWNTILVEEVGEVAKEICDNDFEWFPGDDYRKELIEVATVALSAVQNYDKRNELKVPVKVDLELITHERLLALGFTEVLCPQNNVYQKGEFEFHNAGVYILHHPKSKFPLLIDNLTHLVETMKHYGKE